MPVAAHITLSKLMANDRKFEWRGLIPIKSADQAPSSSGMDNPRRRPPPVYRSQSSSESEDEFDRVVKLGCQAAGFVDCRKMLQKRYLRNYCFGTSWTVPPTPPTSKHDFDDGVIEHTPNVWRPPERSSRRDVSHVLTAPLPSSPSLSRLPSPLKANQRRLNLTNVRRSHNFDSSLERSPSPPPFALTTRSTMRDTLATKRRLAAPFQRSLDRQRSVASSPGPVIEQSSFVNTQRLRNRSRQAKSSLSSQPDIFAADTLIDAPKVADEISAALPTVEDNRIDTTTGIVNNLPEEAEILCQTIPIVSEEMDDASVRFDDTSMSTELDRSAPMTDNDNRQIAEEKEANETGAQLLINTPIATTLNTDNIHLEVVPEEMDASACFYDKPMTALNTQHPNWSSTPLRVRRAVSPAHHADIESDETQAVHGLSNDQLPLPPSSPTLSTTGLSSLIAIDTHSFNAEASPPPPPETDRRPARSTVLIRLTDRSNPTALDKTNASQRHCSSLESAAVTTMRPEPVLVHSFDGSNVPSRLEASFGQHESVLLSPNTSVEVQPDVQPLAEQEDRLLPDAQSFNDPANDAESVHEESISVEPQQEPNATNLDSCDISNNHSSIAEVHNSNESANDVEPSVEQIMLAEPQQEPTATHNGMNSRDTSSNHSSNAESFGRQLPRILRSTAKVNVRSRRRSPSADIELQPATTIRPQPSTRQQSRDTSTSNQSIFAESFGQQHPRVLRSHKNPNVRSRRRSRSVTEMPLTTAIRPQSSRRQQSRDSPASNNSSFAELSGRQQPRVLRPHAKPKLRSRRQSRSADNAVTTQPETRVLLSHDSSSLHSTSADSIGLLASHLPTAPERHTGRSKPGHQNIVRSRRLRSRSARAISRDASATSSAHSSIAADRSRDTSAASDISHQNIVRPRHRRSRSARATSRTHLAQQLRSRDTSAASSAHSSFVMDIGSRDVSAAPDRPERSHVAASQARRRRSRSAASKTRTHHMLLRSRDTSAASSANSSFAEVFEIRSRDSSAPERPDKSLAVSENVRRSPRRSRSHSRTHRMQLRSHDTSAASSTHSSCADSSVVLLESKIPGRFSKRVLFDETQLLVTRDRHPKERLLAPGKWRRSVSAWKREHEDRRSTRHDATSMQHLAVYRRSIYNPNLLDSTNDGSNLAADLSARLSSVLSFSKKPSQPKHSRPKQQSSSFHHLHHHVHFDDFAATDVSRHLRSHQHHQQLLIDRSEPGHNSSGTNSSSSSRSSSRSGSAASSRSSTRIASAASSSSSLLFAVGRDSEPSQQQHASHLDAADARAAVLRRCQQREPLPFDEVYSRSALSNCRKIGEGVYGEVFMRKVDQRAVVLKIIPIEGADEVNGEPQKRFDEILAEIVITAELSALRHGQENATAGFVELLQVRCVRGQYPEHLQELWELYRDNHRTENDHPEVFGDEQLYIVLELANAGQDLEAFQFESAAQSLAALKQISLSLAVAEQQLQFEHRDLHWGNILLEHTKQTHATFWLHGQRIVVPTHNVRTTIIDYTLSRIATGPQVLYNDLADDEELFSAGGDYQFDIYRLMRARLLNVWRRYDPFTNVLWLHYVCDKLIDGARYVGPKTRRHKHAVEELMRLRDQLLHYESAVALVDSGQLELPVAAAASSSSSSANSSSVAAAVAVVKATVTVPPQAVVGVDVLA